MSVTPQMICDLRGDTVYEKLALLAAMFEKSHDSPRQTACMLTFEIKGGCIRISESIHRCPRLA